jgi:hypothetical protein
MKNNLSMANATIEELSHALKLEKNQKVCSLLLFQCIPLISFVLVPSFFFSFSISIFLE